MTTATCEAATPTSTYVPSENIELVIASLDEDLARLQKQDRTGAYIKFDDAFDILLDIRNKLTGLMH